MLQRLLAIIFGATAAPGALASSNTHHHATRAPGLDPPRHIESSRGRHPPPRSTPRPPGSVCTSTVGLRCGKAGAETPSPSLALDSAFPRMNGGNYGLFPIAEDSASLPTPPTPSRAGIGQTLPPASTQVPPRACQSRHSPECSTPLFPSSVLRLCFSDLAILLSLCYLAGQRCGSKF